MPSTMLPAAATGLPIARLPDRMTRAEEYLHLFEQRRHIDRRLSELAELIGPEFAVTLPKSGLRIVASRSGALLCKGAGHEE